MAVVVPAHLFYMAFIYAVQSKFDFSIQVTGWFVGTYCVAVLVQLAILLYLAYVSVFWAWKRRINPDNSAIPFTSALADVLGNCLMAVTFTLLKAINDPNANIIDDGNNNNIINVNITTNTLLNNITTVINDNIINNINYNNFTTATTILSSTIRL